MPGLDLSIALSVSIGGTDVGQFRLGEFEWIKPASSPYGSDFVMTVETTAPNETFTVPCRNSGTFDANIDWGDGSVSAVTAYNDVNLTHTYADAGTHLIRVSGTFPNIYFNQGGDRLKVRTVEQLGDVGWLSFRNGFFKCTNMTKFHSGIICDTSQATEFQRFLAGTSSLVDLDLSTLSVGSATTMEFFLFAANTDLTTIDLTGFDTSNVADMSDAFRNLRDVDIIGIEDFNIEAISGDNLIRFLIGATIPTARYDALLISWGAQTVPPNQNPHFGSSTYTSGSVAEAARTSLITNHGWTITDGGAAL